MSFSREVKEELGEHIGKSRHCKIAELSALIGFEGKFAIGGGKIRLKIDTADPVTKQKFQKLVQALFSIPADREEFTQDEMLRILETVKIWNPKEGKLGDPKDPDAELAQKSCCKRAFLRGAFLCAGSMSDPKKSYHLEIVCSKKVQADKVMDMINSFELDAKVIVRKKNYVVYLKEGEQIVDLLNIIGAHKSLMRLENVRIVKEMRNSVNRQVNCETANIHKTVNAAVRQTAAIEYIQKHRGLDSLPDPLREMAYVRLEHPDASLLELGEAMNPPLGKSGINHRLRKLITIAEDLGMEELKQDV